jgi:uncharacterized protein DUF1018
MPTSNQIKLIHVAKGQLEKTTGFTDDNYRDLLWLNFKVKSSKDLEFRQVDELLRHFKDLGWNKKQGDRRPQTADRKKLRPPPDPDGLVSKEQQVVIEGLRDFLGWHPQKFQAFCLKRFKSRWPQTQKDGQKIIYALIAIGAERLATAIWNLHSENLTAWERGFILTNEYAAEKEFQRFLENKNKRGHRKMPQVSLTKLLEILRKY